MVIPKNVKLGKVLRVEVKRGEVVEDLPRKKEPVDGSPSNPLLLPGGCGNWWKSLGIPGKALTEELKGRVKEIIGKFADTFALEDSEISQAEVFEHGIDTGQAPPIKQAQRPVPFTDPSSS